MDTLIHLIESGVELILHLLPRKASRHIPVNAPAVINFAGALRHRADSACGIIVKLAGSRVFQRKVQNLIAGLHLLGQPLAALLHHFPLIDIHEHALDYQFAVQI